MNILPNHFTGTLLGYTETFCVNLVKIEGVKSHVCYFFVKLTRSDPSHTQFT